jgi:phosphoadenosine phosphosulfate reductase
MALIEDVARAEPTAEGLAVTTATDRRVAELCAEFEGRSTLDVLDASVRRLFAGHIAAVSSFGAESVVLLHLLSEVDRSIPIVFVDTDKLFGETLRYRDMLIARLGLTDVRTIAPDPARVAELDPKGGLWFKSPNLCCHIRKVEPLARGLDGFDAWISGRKRFQAATRSAIPLFEAEGTRIKVNPLADWGPQELQAYATFHALPPHPLVAQGYRSIGCMPCTDPVAPGEDARAGRWRGQEKTECGIHVGGLIAVDEDAGSGI